MFSVRDNGNVLIFYSCVRSINTVMTTLKPRGSWSRRFPRQCWQEQKLPLSQQRRVPSQANNNQSVPMPLCTVYLRPLYQLPPMEGTGLMLGVRYCYLAQL